MTKRVPLILAAILVLAFVAYIAVSSFNGSYSTAARIGSADVTASRQGNALAAKLRTMSGVASASFSFTAGLIAVRKSDLTVAMTSTAAVSDVQRVVSAANAGYGHGVGAAAGAMLTLTMPAAPTLEVTDFTLSSARLHEDLLAWDALRGATRSAITLQLAEPNRRTMTFVSKAGANYSWIAAHYSLLKRLSTAGFAWTNPGSCTVGALPPKPVYSLIAQLATIVPIASCNSAEDPSGLVVLPGPDGALAPFVTLGFVSGKSLQPFSAHASQFAEVSKILLTPGAPNTNVGFFAVANGKLAVLRFFTGTCALGTVTHPDRTDGTSLAVLKAHGVDIATQATLGQCSPKQ